MAFGLFLPSALLAQDEAPAEAAARPDSFFPQPPLSPGGAFLRSLVVPGWGQAELGHQTRGALYFFIEAFAIFMVARTKIRLDQAKANEPYNPSLVDSRDQQLEDWAAIAVFTALFSGADAWVSVQLHGFDERTRLGPEGVALGLAFKLPLGP